MEVEHANPNGADDPNNGGDAAVDGPSGSVKTIVSQSPGKTVSLDMGGPQKTPAFALLDGIELDPVSGKKDRVTVSITRLPAVLGRSHDTKDPNFFGLGTKKAVSRNHFKIFYRDIQGGSVEWDEAKSKLQYQAKKSNEGAKQKPKLAGGKTEADLPPHGFFALECLGKNPIRVNNEKIEPGECMVLESGYRLRISSYMLYFLLPTDAKPQPHKIQIATSPQKKKAPATAPSKKRSLSSPGSDGGPSKKANIAAVLNSPTEALELPITQQSDLDQFSTDILLQMMEKAVTAGVWERKHQIIGSAIALRAVMSAAEAPEIQEPAIRNPGVSRQDLMDWIEKSDKYEEWVKQMLSNMEQRSYVASITKSLLKSGWTRTDGQGRYVRWKLPPDTKIVVDVKEIHDENKEKVKKDDKKKEVKKEPTEDSKKKEEQMDLKSAPSKEDEGSEKEAEAPSETKDEGSIEDEGESVDDSTNMETED